MSDSEKAPDSPLAAWLAATDPDSAGGRGGGPDTTPPVQPTVVTPIPAAAGVGHAPVDAGQTPPRRSWRRLFVLAAVPWVVLAALAGAQALRGEARVGPSAEPAATTLPSAANAPTPPLQTDGTAAVTAAAVAAVSAGPAEGAAPGTVVVESHDMAGAVHVVVVQALMHRAGRPDTARYGVAVLAPDGAPVVAGVWALPALPARPAWADAGDAALLDRAVAAVAAAGYADVRPAALRRDPRLPAVLNLAVEAVAPGDSTRRDHEVWLTPDAAAVLGQPDAIPHPVPTERP